MIFLVWQGKSFNSILDSLNQDKLKYIFLHEDIILGCSASLDSIV